jgi:hypothetical protein
MVARGNPNDQYRGYGDSEDAKPCEEGFMKDARGALKASEARGRPRGPSDRTHHTSHIGS